MNMTWAATNRRLLLVGSISKFGVFQFAPLSPFDSRDNILGCFGSAGCGGSGSVIGTGFSISSACAVLLMLLLL